MADPKKIELQQVPRDERRSAFRKTQTQAHRLSITLRTATGEEFAGTFQDLTLHGASARFLVNAKQLVVGQPVVLIVGSLTRTSRVVAQARVVFCNDVPGGRLCGFQFTDLAALAPQIDSFYGRFFNRRHAQRVSMPLDRKIHVHLFLTGNEIKCELVDLSVDGMKVRAARSQAKELDGANHTFVRFTLPGQKEEIRGRAAILRRSQVLGVVTMGLSFDLLQEGGFSIHHAALQSWIDQRAEIIAKWDRALTKEEKPAPTPPKPDAA